MHKLKQTLACWRRSFDPTYPTQPPPGVLRTLVSASWH